MLLLAILKRNGKVHISLLPVCHLEHEILLTKHCFRKKSYWVWYVGSRLLFLLASCKVEFPFFFFNMGSSLVGRSYKDLPTDILCLPSDFWICFVIWRHCVSCVAGAVTGKIFLFIRHSADLLLLTRSVTPQEPPVSIPVSRGGDYIKLWGTQPFLVSLVGYVAFTQQQCSSDSGSLPFTFEVNYKEMAGKKLQNICRSSGLS